MHLSTAVPSPRTHSLSTNPRDTIKLLTLGDSGSGKTSLLKRYCEDTFDHKFESTIGVDFKVKRLFIEDELVRVQIWDTAGQERFKSITRNYYNGANGILFVYSIDNDHSKKNVERWIRDVFVNHKQRDNDGIRNNDSSSNSGTLNRALDCVLIANKIDLIQSDPKRMNEELCRAETIASHFGLKVFLTSAKENISVGIAFETLIQCILDRRKHENARFEEREKNRIRLDSEHQGRLTTRKSGCCSLF